MFRSNRSSTQLLAPAEGWVQKHSSPVQQMTPFSSLPVDATAALLTSCRSRTNEQPPGNSIDPTQNLRAPTTLPRSASHPWPLFPPRRSSPSLSLSLSPSLVLRGV
mmetsp:Transcript_13580/g.24194  ORF Transcript_13580/g.24194 Transcript_13580/m.24194 type:complete len:106 (-) Transcript_13580:33-350(-)